MRTADHDNRTETTDVPYPKVLFHEETAKQRAHAYTRSYE